MLWADEELTIKARPDVQVEIGETARVDGLDSGKTYYYQVYAKMYNMNNSNKTEEVQLFDYTDKNYKTLHFNTATYGDALKNLSYEWVAPGDGEYGRRVFNSHFQMGDIEYDFDLVYAFCNSSENCEYDEENLKWGNKDANLDDIKEVCDISCSSEFIEHMDNKYTSKIEQGGTNVSGGQKQRLAIARSIAKDPEIYIFDDSFSALDFAFSEACAINSNFKSSSLE